MSHTFVSNNRERLYCLQKSRTFICACILLASLQLAVAAQDKFAQGLVFFNKQSYAEALQCFSDSSVGGSKEAQRLYYCALCYLYTSQPKKAQEIFQKISKNFPASEAARLSEKYLKASSSAGEVSSQSESAQFGAGEPDEIAIPFRRTSKGQVTVSAELHGRSMNMIFDTGAEDCLFGRNQIELADLAQSEHKKAMILNSVAGPIRVYQIVSDIKLGSIKATLPISVQDQNMEAGILGRPFLSAFNCVVDNQSGLIRLRRNSAQASAFPLDSFAIPFTLDGDKMIVSAGINGREVDMCFDTGSFGVCLSKSQCEQLRIKVPDTLAERTHGPNGVAVSSWQVSGEISLGPIHKRAFPIRVIDSEISYPLLGQNFFGDRNYKIDTTKKEIRFAR